MKNEIRNTLKQSLTISQAMKQSISILQANYLDLSEMLMREAASNIFLESNSPMEDNGSSKQYSESEEESSYSYSKDNNYDNEHFEEFDKAVPSKSLFDHVKDQISLEISNNIEKMIAFCIAENIDQSGYIIDYDPQKIANKLKCTKSKVDDVFSKMRKFEPSGIFCRNLRDCLEIQLIEKGLHNESYKLILDNIDLIPKLEYAKLSKICKISEDKIFEMIKVIKNLDPKPGLILNNDAVIPKIPEIIIRVDDKNITTSLNTNAVPKMHLNKDYYIKIRNDCSKDEIGLIHNEYMNASNLVKATENRFKTLLNISSVIAHEQRDFFLKGILYLKPMTLDDIAKLTQMHESTISRAVNEKYVLTPYGIYELKSFFSSKLSSSSSNEEYVSSSKVKELIKSIVSSEGEDVVSDDDIAKMLVKFNIKVARRTVAKYRESIGIKTSSMRKRMLKSKYS